MDETQKDNSKDIRQPEEEEVVYEEEKEAADLEVNVEKLRQRLKDCLVEKQKYLDGWQRTQADFINYRRRQEEQFLEWSKMFGEGLIKDILPVLDSIDAARVAHPDDEGLKILENQFKSVLRKHGLEEIKSINRKFNPEWHEVVECEENLSQSKDKADGNNHSGEIVAEEMQKGYMFNGKVIRPAKVKVVKK